MIYFFQIAVYDYIWKKEATNKNSISNSDVQHLEHYDSESYQDGSKDITTHILIYTIHLKGFRELYRQFLRLPDGAIVEVSNKVQFNWYILAFFYLNLY